MNIPFIRQVVGAAAAVVLLVCTVPVATAQQGAIAGRVTDRVTQQPVIGAEVLVLGTNLGGRVGQDGRYRISNISAGQYTLQVRLIGYATASQQVSVTAGGTATVDFAVSAAAVPLEAVVVTATGAEQLKRELGHTVATIDAAKTVEQATPTNLADLLNARAPGVQVLPSGGTTGTGSRIRIRGSSSLSLTNEPIIVVDGIRVENGATGQTATSIGVGGQTPSRLNDISPEDIESIEIVKGPSAAARSAWAHEVERLRRRWRPERHHGLAGELHLCHQRGRLVQPDTGVGWRVRHRHGADLQSVGGEQPVPDREPAAVRRERLGGERCHHVLSLRRV